MRRAIAILLAAALSLTAGNIAVLNIRIVEGDGASYGLGSRATRGVTVEVTDEAGRPLSDVAVSFRLPEEGATGTFATGTRTDVATTNKDGRASVWGMKWNRVVGDVPLRITAAQGSVRAGVICTQHLTAAPQVASAVGVAHTGSHSKMLYVVLAVAGAAGGGIAMGMARGSTKTASSPAAVALSVGAPSVIIGAP